MINLYIHCTFISKQLQEADGKSNLDVNQTSFYLLLLTKQQLHDLGKTLLF